MKFKFLILFIMFFSDSFGQMNLNQEVKTLGESIKDFVPENWKVLQLKKGDLNKDKVEDIAVVIQLS
ncbi:hypothetical protein CYCD_11540 [Tenuifilaceae bacterium CYCD]|nr:hypothetical protein CYCD_11540 [Tenuifilaceae bacterium CYCD]